ncbi:hypothetical protein ABIA38_006462 [Embleya sp. AB8]
MFLIGVLFAMLVLIGLPMWALLALGRYLSRIM